MREDAIEKKDWCMAPVTAARCSPLPHTSWTARYSTDLISSIDEPHDNFHRQTAAMPYAGLVGAQTLGYAIVGLALAIIAFAAKLMCSKDKSIEKTRDLAFSAVKTSNN
jgi:hypothetical protein